MKFAAALLATGAIAGPSTSNKLHQTRDISNDAWTKRNAADPDEPITARFALKQQNVERGHDMLMDV